MMNRVVGDEIAQTSDRQVSQKKTSTNNRLLLKTDTRYPKKAIMYLTWKNLGCLLLGLCSPCVLGDGPENEHTIVLTPAMAAFYNIDNKGRSVLEAPVVAVISPSNARPRATVMGSRPSSQRRTRQRRGPSRAVSIRVTRTNNAREAHRCEQHGLYYTTDGRCILPFLGAKQASGDK